MHWEETVGCSDSADPSIPFFVGTLALLFFRLLSQLTLRMCFVRSFLRFGYPVLLCSSGWSQEGLCSRGFGYGVKDEEVGQGGLVA